MLRKLAVVLAICVAAITSTVPQRAEAFAGIDALGGILWGLSPSIEIGSYFAPITPFYINTRVIINPNSGFIQAMIKAEADKADRIFGHGNFSLQAPTYLDAGFNAPTLVYLPSGTASIRIKPQNGGGTVRWKVYDYQQGAWVLNTTTFPSSGVLVNLPNRNPSLTNYSVNQGKNRFNVRYCYNSACTSYTNKIMRIQVDSAGAPPMFIHPGYLANSPVNGVCQTSSYYKFSAGGETTCLRVFHLDDTNVLAGMGDPDMQHGARVFILNPALPGYAYTGLYEGLIDYFFRKFKLVSAAQTKCDQEEEMCSIVARAAVEAYGVVAQCTPLDPTDSNEEEVNNALRHATWQAMISKRAYDDGLATTPQAAAQRAAEWGDVWESPAGCPNPNAGANSDCLNNEVGRNVFLENANKTPIEIKRAVYKRVVEEGVAYQTATNNPPLTQAQRNVCSLTSTELFPGT